ncbi:hypothetical protein MWU78_19580 [Arenibacter sp. F26102]|uniref:hypothetical protein n=1 Tax=Arenibacter sp. F26102 TaxID=2926416 RepID=UPI001FF65695|nr:hypothetical protein [Arenibacter sp. F26102]MCK0147862.1 hypothetical protein [Arenibacter sp. F26102]
MKKVVVQFDFRGMTTKQYDQCWVEIRKAGHAQPKGLLHHYGAAVANGMLVVDVWESAERFEAFGKILMPIFEKLKIPKTKPNILPLHYEYNANLVAH